MPDLIIFIINTNKYMFINVLHICVIVIKIKKILKWNLLIYIYPENEQRSKMTTWSFKVCKNRSLSSVKYIKIIETTTGQLGELEL